MSNRFLISAGAASVALAALSLAIPYELVYDAWAWLVWGRELTSLALDTTLGPSFKPLPVLLAAPLSLAGDLAPELWLVLVRASWLLAPVLAGALAYHLTGDAQRRMRLAGAGFAALSLLLLYDDVTPWTRQGAAGMSDPPLVALVLGAVLAALRGRPRLALALAGAAALVRPEVWPLLAVYGAWCWRALPQTRSLLAGLAVGVPALWFVPDLLGSGSAGAGGRALGREGAGGGIDASLQALGRAALMPLFAAWPLAVLAVWRRRGTDRTMQILGAGALGWIAIVVAMAAAGFPGLPRFSAPAIAIVGVLGGAGLALLPALASRPAARAGVALLCAAVLVQVVLRAAELHGDMASSARIARSHERVRDLAREIGREPLLRCGRLATSDVLVRTELAWELGVGLARVVSFGEPSARSGAFVVGPRATPLVAAFLRGHGTRLGSREEWSVYAVACPRGAGTLAASSRRSPAATATLAPVRPR
jgi:hypothetical protein